MILLLKDNKQHNTYSYINGVSVLPAFDPWWNLVQERLQKT